MAEEIEIIFSEPVPHTVRLSRWIVGPTRGYMLIHAIESDALVELHVAPIDGRYAVGAAIYRSAAGADDSGSPVGHLTDQVELPFKKPLPQAALRSVSLNSMLPLWAEEFAAPYRLYSDEEQINDSYYVFTYEDGTGPTLPVDDDGKELIPLYRPPGSTLFTGIFEPKRTRRLTHEDLIHTARCYELAAVLGLPSSKMLAEHYQVSLQAARSRVARARDVGLISITAPAGRRPSPSRDKPDNTSAR